MIRCLSLLTLLYWGCPYSLTAQDAKSLVQTIHRRQATLRTVVYTVERTDTLVTGHTRQLKGQVYLRVTPADTTFGHHFRASQPDQASTIVYDGRLGYVADDRAYTYTLIRDAARLPTLLQQGGGRLLVTDLLRLDTSRAVALQLRQDAQTYYLTVHYVDLPDDEIVDRYKTVAIAKATLLPVSVRQHQQTMGKVQDLHWRIQSMQIDQPLPGGLVEDPAFLNRYRLLTPNRPQVSRSSLLDQPAPAFRLASLAGDTVDLSALRGKIVILDFWEVWCGPCVAALPKIDSLHRAYAGRGVAVLGITHEAGQLAITRQLATKRGLHFPTLVGTEDSRRAYQLNAVPYYVLIDRHGIVRLTSEGDTRELQRTLDQLLVP
jgi:thiol-disulfide isomerase/thioredoxin